MNYGPHTLKHVNVRALRHHACMCTHRSLSCNNSLLDFTNPLYVTELHWKERGGAREGNLVSVSASTRKFIQLSLFFLFVIRSPCLSTPSACNGIHIHAAARSSFKQFFICNHFIFSTMLLKNCATHQLWRRMHRV